MTTFETYDEEKALIEQFGEKNVVWDGQEFRVVYKGKEFWVAPGAVTRLGIENVPEHFEKWF